MESQENSIDNQSVGREVFLEKDSVINNESHVHFEMQLQLKERLDHIIKSTQIEELITLIKEYCRMVAGRHEEKLFMSYFVENKFLEILKQKLQELNFESSLVGIVFAEFEVLLQTVKNPDNLIYFLVTMNQLGYLSEKYDFIDDYGPYYANFLKLLCFTIKEKQMYLSVFFNSREPHFPLIMNLLKLSTCSDEIMQTKVKLGIIEISRSNNPAIKRYIVNFPFVIFYPKIINQMRRSLDLVLGDENEKIRRMESQNLVNQLIYMREFMMEKDEMLIDMFSNTFLQIIGKRLYGQINNIDDHYTKRIKNMLKLLVEMVVPQIDLIEEQIRNSIPEIQGDNIKIGLSMLISPYTTPSLLKCFQGDVIEMDQQYWLMDECQQDVVNHCKSIFFNDIQDNDSIIKVMGSYIPWSKNNWLYYEMKKISQCIGMHINLNEPLTHDSHYLPGSFLTVFGRLSEQQHMPNPLFEKIIKDEELLYWYIRLTHSLFYRHKKDLSFCSFDQIIKQLLNCNSLALVQSFYLLLLQEPLRMEQSDLSFVYSQVTERLIHYVITKGWDEFMIKIRQSRLQQNDKDFYLDVYREIECDILLFVVIKTLLGSLNDQGSAFNRAQWNMKSDKTSEITFYCQKGNRQGEWLLFTLDGQYLYVKNEKKQKMHQEGLLIRNLKFQEVKDGVVEIAGRESDSWGATLCFSNQITAHIRQEIASRKRLAMRIELQLKSMKFEFTY